MSEERTSTSRRLAISIVATWSFLLGIAGTLAGIALGLLLLQPPARSLSTSFITYGTFLTLLWLVIGPILIYSSYNLFKRKKWAAQMVAAVVLFDLATSPLFLIASQSSIDPLDFLAWSADIVILFLLAYAWNSLFTRSPP